LSENRGPKISSTSLLGMEKKKRKEEKKRKGKETKRNERKGKVRDKSEESQSETNHSRSSLPAEGKDGPTFTQHGMIPNGVNHAVEGCHHPSRI